VHVQVVKIAANRRHIFRCGKPGQSFLVNPDAQGRDRCNQNVDSQVELKAINQVRLVQVPLAHVVLVGHDPVVVAGQENAAALAAILRLDDEGFGLALVELLLEELGLAGQQPRFREELEVCLEVILECQQVLRQKVFPGHRVAPRKVISPLVALHLLHEGRKHAAVNEPDIPVLFPSLVVRQSQVAFLRDIVNHIVLSEEDIHDQRSFRLAGFLLHGRERFVVLQLLRAVHFQFLTPLLVIQS